MIELKNVSIVKDNHSILNECSCFFSNETLNTLSGPSGIGKTRILQAIFDLTGVISGSLAIDGLEIKLGTIKEKQQHLREISYVSQDFKLIDKVTILDNVIYSVPEKRITKNNHQILTEMLASLNLTTVLDKYPTELSGGEKQRVALAIALLKQPKIILADEPTSNLDKKNAQLVITALEKAHQRYNTCILIATHNSEILTKHDYNHFRLAEKKVRSIPHD